MRHHWRKERRMLRAYARTGVDPVFAEDDEAVERADADVPRRRELSGMLAALSKDEREILLLHAWAGLTDTEIAETPSACRSAR